MESGAHAGYWIPAFAGMTVQALIVRLQTGACYRERLQEIEHGFGAHRLCAYRAAP